MKSDDIILGILSENPSTGYEIKKRFETIFSNFYNASFGSIYPILHKLEKENKIKVEIIEQKDKPNKKNYYITDLGKKAFLEYLSTPVEENKVKLDFMTRIYYGKYLSKEKLISLIDNEIKKYENELIIFKQLEKDFNLYCFQEFSFRIGLRNKEFMIQELKKFKKKWAK